MNSPQSRHTAPQLLGYAGLLPQLLALAVLVAGPFEWHFTAIAMAYAYAALIFSFLGGLWWGAAARDVRSPAWVYVAGVVPSLIALASAIPWAIGTAWPGPSLIVLGVGILLSPLVDRRLAAQALVPDWWMTLRWHLSLGLGALSIAIAWVGPGVG